MVAVGTLISRVLDPVGQLLDADAAGLRRHADGRFVPADWWAVIFNPSFPYRLVHMVLAAYLTTALVVGAVGAWHLLRDAQNAARRGVMFSMAMWMAAMVAPIQIIAGDLHGLNTLEHQPAKIAAIEGHFDTEPRHAADPVRLARHAAETTRYAVAIPHLGALILTHDWNGSVKGLKTFPPRGPAAGRRWCSGRFRVMVGLGLLMVGARPRRALVRAGAAGSTTTRWLQRAAVAMAPSGLHRRCSRAGSTTEVGRQPFTVYGLLRTADSVSPIAAPGVATSLAAFAVVYLIVFGAGSVTCCS